MSGAIQNRLAAANLADGRLQLWTADENLALFSRQQQTTDPNSGWTPMSPFQTPQAKAVTFVAVPLRDGRLQLFVVDGAYPGQIWSTWQVTPDPSSGWTPLTPFQTPQAGARFLAAGPLSDEGLQLFIVDDANQIWSTQKQTDDSDTEWTPLKAFQTPQTGARLLAADPLHDEGLQLFITELSNSQIWSTWQQTTEPDSAWTPLSPFQTSRGAASLAAAPLSDKRLQLFVTDGTGQGPIWSTCQQTTDPNSGWTPFSQLS